MKTIKGLICVLVLTIICLVPFMAFGATVNDGNITLLQDENSFYTKQGFSRVTKEKVYGIGGLGEDEDCIKLTGGDVTGHGNWYTQCSWTGSSEYVVVEFDVMLSDKTTHIQLATGGHTPVTPIVSTIELCRNDTWGNFVAIINTKEGTSDLYYNNLPVSLNYPTPFNDGTANHSYIRIVVAGENDSIAYLNNFKMYETNTKPEVVASPAIEGCEYDSVVTAQLDSTFDDNFTVSDDTTVTIYKDTTYTETLSKTDYLPKGAVAVLKNELGYRFYYITVDDGIYVEDWVSDGTIPVRKGQTEVVYGMFGKQSGDASQKIISDSSLPCFTSYTWLNDDYEGKIRADFNIEPGNMQRIYIGTNVNLPVTGDLALYSGRWNRVSVVYDTESFDKKTGKGIATLYVNGIEISETPTAFEHLAQLRVVAVGEAGSYAYVDDFSVTQFSKTEAEILMPPVILDEIEVQNGIITQKGITVGNIKSKTKSDKIRVYRDSLFDYQLGENEYPEFGNIAVFESIDNVYSYYPIYGELSTNEVINIFQNVEAFKFNGGTTTAVTTLGGKDETDVSFKVAVSSGNYCNFNYKWENANHLGYVVTELNIYPGDATVYFWTSEFAPYAPQITGLNKNQWNKVTLVYNTMVNDDGKYTVDMYVNGVYASSNNTTAKSGDELMIFVSGDVGTYVYMDDFKVYETDFVPFITIPDISNDYYTFENNVVLEDGETPLSLTVRGYSAKAFYDELCKNPVGEKAPIPVGATMVVYDRFNNFRYYKVSDEFKKNIIATGDGETTEKISFSDVSMEKVTAVHGREAGDTSYKLTMKSAQDTNNGYLNFDYANMNEDRYLVFEASAFSEADCKIRIGTRYHNPISADITTDSGKYNKNQWNRIVYIFDKKEKIGYFYINGTLCSTKGVTDFTINQTNFRFVIYAPNGTVHYMDDISIYEANAKPNPVAAGVIQPGLNYLINSSILYMPEDIDMKDIRTVFGIDDKIDIKLIKDGQKVDFASGGKFPDNSTVVLDKGNSVITSYDINVVKNNDVIMYGTSTESGVLSDGVLTVAVPLSDMSQTNARIGIAKYKEGNLVSIQAVEGNIYARFAKCDIDIDTSAVDTVKVFVWNNKYVPLSKNGAISVQ